MAMLDDFGKLALERYTSTVNVYNEQIVLAKSIDSREAFAESFMDKAPALAELNDKIDRLRNALESVLSERLILATPLIEPAYAAAVLGAGVNPEALKAQLATIRATSKYITSMYGDDALENTPKIETIRNSSGGGSLGGRRIRGVEVYVDGVLAGVKNANGEVKSNFSHAAKVLEIDTTMLQRQFFTEAGSEDVRSSTFPTIVEFSMPDKSGAERNIRVVKVDDSSEDE